MNHFSTFHRDHASFEFATHSPAQTRTLGNNLGRRLQNGLTILLFGDLACGKTIFCKGLAKGLKVPSSYAITSPTYTLINEYPGRLPFFHVDLYRLPEPVEPDEIGLQEIFEGDGICAVEWSERLHMNDRPSRRLELFFLVTGDSSRKIRIIAYGLDPSDLLHGIDIFPTDKKTASNG